MGNRVWMWAAAAALLAACGGGSDGPSAPPAQPGPPTIVSLGADKPAYAMGERALLTPTFSGGSGRIEPGIGAVRSGVAVATPVLDGDVTYRLIVEAPGQAVASRALALPVDHRDRHVDAGTFQSVHHSAAELPDGSVLIIGGSRGESVFSNSIDRFDPATRSFARVGTMATGRAMARPVVLADGKVLIAGGATTIASGVTYELLDVGTGQVTPAGVPVRNRIGHTATRLADGRVLIAGGFEDDSAELWDPATRNARPVAARMANPREWHSATLLADGRVLLVGGYTVADAYWLAEIFDPRTEQFTPIGTPRLAPLAESLALHLAHRLADGTVLIAGGEKFNPDVDAAGRPTADVLQFDPATLRFIPQPGLLVARALPTGAVLADDRLVMFGGLATGDDYTSTGEVYRLGRAPQPTANLAVARAYHTVSRLPGGRLLIVGGEAPDRSAVTSVLIYE